MLIFLVKGRDMIDIWKLFRSEFKDGQFVIIIHSNTKMYHGKMKADHDRVVVGCREFSWDDVIFIAHDGFPCRQFHTTLNAEQLDNLENTEAVLLMRKLLTKKPEEEILSKENTVVRRTSSPFRSTFAGRGGCPFVWDEVYMQIVNPGNGYTEDYEESVIMKSKDNATGILWGIEDEIFEFAGVTG